MSGLVHAVATNNSSGSASPTGQRRHDYIGRHRRGANSSDRSIWSATPPTVAGSTPEGFARYIGRVGALAVALGIGAAIATAPATAFADPSTTDNSSTSAPPAADTDDPASADKPDNSPKPAPNAPPSPPPAENSGISEPAEMDDTAHDDSPLETSSDTLDEPVEGVRNIRSTRHPRSSSRGADNDRNDSPVVPRRLARTDTPDRTAPDAAPSAAAAKPQPTTPSGPSPTPSAQPSTLSDPIPAGSQPDVKPPSEELVSAMSTVLFGSSPTSPVHTPATWALLPMARRELNGSQPPDTAAATVNTALVVDGAVPAAAQFVTLAGPGNHAPVSTADPSMLDPEPETGKITGAVHFTDPDGDVMSYSAPVTSARGGTVTVVFGTGTFTYTPTAAMRMQAGSPTATSADMRDSFVVTVTEYPGMLTTTQTVTVDISPLHPVTIIDVDGYATGVAVSPDGTRAYSANDNFVTVIDTGTSTVIATIQVADTSGNPHDIAVSPDGAHVYVSVDGGGLAVVDTDTYAVQTISIPATNFQSGTRVKYMPGALAVDPASGIVYAAHTVIELPPDGIVRPVFTGRTGAIIVAFDPTSGTVTASAQPIADMFTSYGEGAIVAVDGAVHFLSYDLATNYPILVTLNAHLTVLSTTNLASQNPFALPGGKSLAVSPDGSRTYAIAPTERSLVVVDNVSRSVVATVPLDYPTGVLAVNPVTGDIYVQGQVVGQPGIAVIDPASLTVVDSVPGIWPISAISVSTDGNYLYASMLGYDSVAQVYIGDPGSGAVNHDPYFDADITSDPDADGMVAGHVHATDPDGDTLTYSVPGTTGLGHVEIDSETGEYVYIPTDTARHAAAADGAGFMTDTFTVTADDGHGGTATYNVSVHIAPMNTLPTVSVIYWSVDPDSGDTSFHLFTGDPATGHTTPLPTNDEDGDTVTYTVVDSPAAGFNPLPVSPDGTVQIAHGVVSLDAANEYVYYTLTDDEARHDAAAVKAATGEDLYDGFWVKLDDGHGGVLYVEFRPLIAPVNSPPAFYADQDDPATGPDRTVSGDLIAYDDDGDTLVYSVSSPPSNGTVQIDPATGHYTYTPDDESAFGDDFTVTVTDGHGGSDTYDVEIDIDPVNHPPTIDTTIIGTDITTGKVRFEVEVDDPDDDGLHITFAAPAHGSVRFDDGSGEYVYTPTPAARHAAATGTGPKTDSFLVTVDDENGGQASTIVTVDIVPANQAPAFDATQSPPGTATNGVVSGPLHATDPDNDTLTYTVHTGPGRGHVDVLAGTGHFTYTPTAEARHAAAKIGAGTGITTDTFTVTVSDGHGGTDTYTVTVDISPQNSVPVHVSDRDQQSTDKDTGRITGRVIYHDADGDPLTYVVVGAVRFALAAAPAMGSVTVDPATGGYTYTPTAEALATGGADSFTIIATDGHLGTASPVTISVSITVPGAGPVSPPIPTGSGGEVGDVGGGLLPVGSDVPAAPLTDTGRQEQTDQEPDRAETVRRESDNDPGAANPAEPASDPAALAVPALASPASPTSDLPTQQGEPDSPEPEVSLTNMVEGGAQGMIMSLILLVIGGWIFTRRILEQS